MQGGWQLCGIIFGGAVAGDNSRKREIGSSSITPPTGDTKARRMMWGGDGGTRRW